MSHARPIYSGEITIDTLGDLLAFHRRTFGGMEMNAGTPVFQPPQQPGAQQQPAPAQQQEQGGQQQPQAPQRPEGVSEEEWNALGDPGRTAIVRERARATAAERALAASRQQPQQPAPAQQEQGKEPQQAQPEAGKPAGGSQEIDIEAIVTRAVTAAVKPFQDAETQRQADTAAATIADAVLKAAETKFVDPSDALAGINLTGVTDGNGAPDATKIATELESLLQRKPHLGKTPDGRRYAVQNGPAGAQPVVTAPLDQRVQSSLARMQASAGIKPPASTS